MKDNKYYLKVQLEKTKEKKYDSNQIIKLNMNLKENQIINLIKITKRYNNIKENLLNLLIFYNIKEKKGIKKGKILEKIDSFEDELKKEIDKKMNNNITDSIRNIIPFTNYIIIYLIIIISFIKIILSNNNLYFIESKFSNITLKINGTGDKYIFSKNNSDFKREYYPNIIYINGENMSTISNHYNFKQTDNLVQLIWYNNIDNCSYMFFGCSDIEEIDLSNFDTSNITNMYRMFSDCKSLSLLNL